MINQELLTIRPAADPVLFDRFAEMMAATDPWKTLGMDGVACRAGFEGGFEGGCKEIHVAYWKDEPAGLVILQVCGTFNGYIQTLFVAEAFRGRGFGKRLLEFCEERVYRVSPNIFICVSTFNIRALRLYEAVGFTVVGELKDFLKPGFDEWLLRKTIGPRLGFEPASYGPTNETT